MTDRPTRDDHVRDSRPRTMTNERETDLREAIVSLLDKRDVGKTICPSEASRAVSGAERGIEKEYMDRTRGVAQKLVDEGIVEVTQRGQVVDMSRVKGPIRIRKTVQ